MRISGLASKEGPEMRFNELLRELLIIPYERERFSISGRYLTEFSDYDTKFPLRKHIFFLS
jgi:hypothetical protein